MLEILKVAICDDQELYLKKVRSQIEKFSILNSHPVEISVFNNAKNLIKSNKEKHFDILFLDIKMPEISGFELAKSIKNNKNEIIFFTNNSELVFESFEFKPFGFIRKQYLEKELLACLNRYYKEIEMNAAKIQVNFKHDVFEIRVSDILYLESYSHTLTFYLRCEKEVEIRDNISNWVDRLESYGFIRINVGILVNYRAIIKNDKNTITLINGKMLPVSRSKVSETGSILARLWSEELM